MGKNKKQRKADRKKKRRHFKNEIPDVQIDPRHAIPESAALNSTISEFEDKIVVTFEHYKSNACELEKLQRTTARKLSNQLKKLTSITKRELPESRLIRDSIVRTKNSEFLYKGLSPDVEVKEIAFGEKERLFGYMVDRYFCIIAVTVTHPL